MFVNLLQYNYYIITGSGLNKSLAAGFNKFKVKLIIKHILITDDTLSSCFESRGKNMV